ncbi:MAG: mevalonate kinase [Candidatus Levybacteria bacterium]|nr:mevalonate kinase [Candidatus Levybacteria bacterium]MDZ4228613.1 mevalonate kinase [Candidatus Levybacteria bacterium]
MIKISVPAKVHLLGEHAVVYGKPALLAAINKRIFVEIISSKNKQILGIKEYEKEIKQLLSIIEREIKKRTKTNKIEPYSITIKSDIPIGAGLGSSAALSAALTAGLLSFLKIRWDKKMVFEIAYEGERFFHGNPSGGDLAAVMEGGFLWFRKDLEFIKTFTALPFKLHKNVKSFVLVDSGKPKESTKEMIEQAYKFKVLSPEIVKELFDSQEDLTKQMATALKEGDEDDLIKSIKLGEQNLEKLGVVGQKAKALIREIEKSGGAAKISGKGGVKDGSGIVIAYHKDFHKLNSLFLHLGFKCSKISLGEQGLR